jgi:hypothetical protein
MHFFATVLGLCTKAIVPHLHIVVEVRHLPARS